MIFLNCKTDLFGKCCAWHQNWFMLGKTCTNWWHPKTRHILQICNSCCL